MKKKDWERIAYIHDEARKIELRSNNLIEAYLTLEETYENEKLFSYNMLVAENKEGLVVGFIAFEEDEISWLYVDPTFHRQGIASALVDEAIKKCGEIIYIEVLHKNESAISFYKNKGFELKKEVNGKMPGNESFDVTCFVLEYKK